MTVMMTIIMRVVMLVEMMTGMVRNVIGVTKMMIEAAGLAMRMVERKIIMAGILMNVMAEMVIGMMSIEEVRKVIMVQEIQASVETVPLMMMTAQSG